MSEDRDIIPLDQCQMLPIASSPLPSQKLTIANDYLQNIYRRVALVTVTIPCLGVVAAIELLWNLGIGAVEIGLLLGMYAVTTFGVEVGFHRHFSHHAFQTTTSIKVILAILGAMAAQGGVVYWVAHHRRHHQYADVPGDPHSPHLHENSLRGLWHAHLGWTLNGEVTNSMVFARDLLRDPVIAKVNQLQQVWVILGLAIPTIIGGLLTMTWMGAFEGLIWGGLVRIFLAHQVINSTNSICHLYGSRPFDSSDRSANNLWLAIPSWGQSWHNNHHAFPNSAVVGLDWWQIDLGGWVIRLLEKSGLAWNVKVPTASLIEAKRSI
ncbi:acyl-CoA desaturase [Aliterella atlantica]|nr:acyl-CoA desaturase [Aliterella atlantica]